MCCLYINSHSFPFSQYITPEDILTTNLNVLIRDRISQPSLFENQNIRDCVLYPDMRKVQLRYQQRHSQEYTQTSLEHRVAFCTSYQGDWQFVDNCETFVRGISSAHCFRLEGQTKRHRQKEKRETHKAINTQTFSVGRQPWELRSRGLGSFTWRGMLWTSFAWTSWPEDGLTPPDLSWRSGWKIPSGKIVTFHWAQTDWINFVSM